MQRSLEPVRAGDGGTLEGAWAALVSDRGPLADAWGSAPAIVRRTGLAASFPAVDELLATPLLGPPYLTLMRGGKALPTERFCRQERVVMLNRPELRLALDRVEAEVREGAAIKLNRMELWSPPIAAIAREIGRRCGKRVKVWGFQSAQGERMVPAHRDPAHVLALQIDGRKRWQLDGPAPDGPWSALAPVASAGPPVIDVLESGDVLYLPYGFAHSAAAETATSYHVAFALESTTAGELRTRIVRALYDAVDRGDSTELDATNLPGIVDEMRFALRTLSTRLETFGRDELSGVEARDLERLLNGTFPAGE